MWKVFVDGSAGTTGLRIVERLEKRPDLCLLKLPDGQRKDTGARLAMIREADAAVLCLPDDAAAEIASLAADCGTVIIDTSTAHRVSEGWVYGFPELPGQRERIRSSTRIANPGCHATGFIALVAPLRQAGLIPEDARLSCFSLTGYTGGGKRMIEAYEAAQRSSLLDAPRLYGLSQRHKHLPEMQKLCALASSPVFCPVVAPFPSGMEVLVPLQGIEPEAALSAYTACYADGMVRVAQADDGDGFLSAGAMAGRDDLVISVWGSAERLVLCARFDNLGKGASGAAIQNMNLALGCPECLGLEGGCTT